MAAQAFGMMGWRVGYIAYQDRDGLGDQLLKVQDTIAVRPLHAGPCPSNRDRVVVLFLDTPLLVEHPSLMSTACSVKHSLLGERRVRVGAMQICPPQLSQHVALGATIAGRGWVTAQLESIIGNRCPAASSSGSPMVNRALRICAYRIQRC